MMEYSKWLPIFVVFIAGFFALHQIKANNITNARIKWLDNLKLLVADFFSEATGLLMKEGVSRSLDLRRKYEPNKEQHQLDYDKMNYSVMEHLQAVELKYSLIKLNLNPKEKLHINFEEILEAFMDLINKAPDANDNEYLSLLNEIGICNSKLILISRCVIKLEWERTKRSYLSRLYYKSFGKGRKIKTDGLDIKI
jgi:hypothetical protein